MGTQTQKVLLSAASETAAVHSIGGHTAALALRSLVKKLRVLRRVRVSHERVQEMSLLQPLQQLPCGQGEVSSSPSYILATFIVCPETKEHIKSAC